MYNVHNKVVLSIILYVVYTSASLLNSHLFADIEML